MSRAVDRQPDMVDPGDVERMLRVSASTVEGAMMSMTEFHSWLSDHRKADLSQVARVPFADMSGWKFQADTGNLVHVSGKFFSVEGLRVRADRSWINRWTQPIIIQPEIGILGILMKVFDGVPHCLMQAKMEPGNISGIQLSPTVQATRSNYTRVHGGSGIKHLEYFVQPGRSRMLVDVLQSEQGAWFLHKRNRNMLVETAEDVPPDENFCWLTVGQIRQLLMIDHLVNMDARTVLSCIPPTAGEQNTRDWGNTTEQGGAAAFHDLVSRSLSGIDTPLHPIRGVLSWLTGIRTRRELLQQRVPLNDAFEGGWHQTDGEIAHVDDKYFQVIATRVRTGSREVGSWTQPLIAPTGPGLVALLVKPIGGVLHALVQARIEAGLLNVAELAATVHCQPNNYENVPEKYLPAFLRYVLSVDPARIRCSVMQSEEGGRFYHAENRYMVIEVADDFPEEEIDDYRWMTLHQLIGLLEHSNYLNVELRGMVACIQSL